jgi:hypothetical protein
LPLATAVAGADLTMLSPAVVVVVVPGVVVEPLVETMDEP